MRPADFTTDLAFSFTQEEDDKHRLRLLFDGARVEKTPTELDRQGADYIVTDSHGRAITVDVKRRRPGVERYWVNNQPELALELVADVERDIPGWAVGDGQYPDFFVFAFDAPTQRTYSFKACDLRYVTRAHAQEWSRLYGVRETLSEREGRTWVAQWVPVPAWAVRQAVDPLRPPAARPEPPPWKLPYKPYVAPDAAPVTDEPAQE